MLLSILTSIALAFISIHFFAMITVMPLPLAGFILGFMCFIFTKVSLGI